MAFNAAASSSSKNDSWKAQAFINIYLPLKSGKRVKVGAIPLKQANAFQAKLIERLSSGEEAQKAFMNAIELNFQLVSEVPAEDIDF